MKNNEANANDIIAAETQFNPERCKAIARNFFIRLTPRLFTTLLNTVSDRNGTCARVSRLMANRIVRPVKARRNGSQERVNEGGTIWYAIPCFHVPIKIVQLWHKYIIYKNSLIQPQVPFLKINTMGYESEAELIPFKSCWISAQ